MWGQERTAHILHPWRCQDCWCWSLLPGRIINYQFYRQSLRVGRGGKKVELSFWSAEFATSCCKLLRRSLPRRVGSTAQFQCYKLRSRIASPFTFNSPRRVVAHMAYVQYHGTLKITLIAFCSCCRPGHTHTHSRPFVQLLVVPVLSYYNCWQDQAI